MCIVTLAVTPTSHAQPTPVKPSAKAEANRHFKNGVALYAEAKFKEALAEFERAHSLSPHPLVLYNLGITHRALSRYALAIEFLNKFLKKGPGVVKPESLAKGKTELAEIEKLVVRITIQTQPAGALVTSGTRTIGTTPLSASVVFAPGEHQLRATLAGHRPAVRNVRVAAGDVIKVVMPLTKIPVVRKPRPPVRYRPTPMPLPVRARELPRLSVAASVGTNAREIADTGAPVVGVGYRVMDKLSVGVDLVLVAFSIVPSARYRIAGDKLSVHGIAAVPVSLTDGDDADTFASVAAGVGVRYQATESIALRLESWLSYAGSDRGTTVPTFAGAELWF